jgi:[3-methyl-2-oxobutanoate dehydrogenase (acetyl-transferring)] kinase
MFAEAAANHQQQSEPFKSHLFPTPTATAAPASSSNQSPPAGNANSTNSRKKLTNTVSESRERLHNIRHFYADPEIDKACERPLIRLNPMAMMYMGVSEDNSHLLKSANYLRNELPIRLAYIIKELRNLPFIIGCNPSMLEIHERCIRAFRDFDIFDKEIKDLDAERRFNQIVHNMLEMNKDLLALLCDGFKDTRRYIRNESFIKTNLNRILSARLGIRLLSEHHIALNKQSNLNKIFVSEDLNDDYAEEAKQTNIDYLQSSSPSDSSSSSASSAHRDENWVGIIHRKFSPKKLVETSCRLVTRLCVEKYGVAPKVKIDGHTNAQFPYLPLPLEYILPELLKNAFRATCEQHRESAFLPDVNITIAVNEKDFVIRIRDRGGGVPHATVGRIFDYHFTTAYDEQKEKRGDVGSNQDGSGASSGSSGDSMNIFVDNSAMGMICEASSTRGLAVMHGYGFGLPTSKAYAEYLGGSLTCQSMQGIGSDFYLRLGLLDVEPEVVRI